MEYIYVKEFVCELSGDRMVVVRGKDGVEIAIEFRDYINNYYTEQDKDEYMYELETM